MVISRISHRQSIGKQFARISIDITILCILLFFGVNYSIVAGTRNDIKQVEDIFQPLDAVIVLGASVQGLQLSPILQDRVETGIQMYQRGKAKKIIISGDNGKKYYNEVDAMFAYLINRGIPSEDIIMDTEGFNTFHSIAHLTQHSTLQYVGIITQEFHLPRAIFMAQGIGIDAVGIISDRASYIEIKQYHTRESFARIKALGQVIRWHLSHR